MDPLPPLHALAAFEAAARHLSFLKASDELCVTQSAVSHRIRQLEDWLGVKLFLRMNRNVVLTAQGENYLHTVREALAQIAQATQLLRRGVRHSLRVSVAPALGSKWLSRRLIDFQRLHPEVDLVVSSSTQLANIRSGEVDVGVRYGRGDWPGLVVRRLLDESLIVVCSPDYCVGLGGIAAPADLARATLLRHALLPWKPWFAQAGLDWPEPRSGPLFDDAVMMMEAAAAGAGIAIMLATLARDYLASGTLVQPLALAARDRSYYAVVAPEAADRPWVQAFVDWVAGEAQADGRSRASGN